KLKPEDVKAAEEAIAEARSHLEEDTPVLKEQIEKLNQIAHTLAQAMYAQAQSEGDKGPGGDQGGEGGGG
ncbi:MAG: molecular chaperone DnaK, partial [Nitrospinaceae bacterium]|nr:molecular chaperone DnaK [Nitrospinaceae bacterium]NIR53201.1 molecular chaperone DnaK [Nitrospinaceae bacterium]NIS83596.1 molecular chaperone DnaK [Nitrospinaceae bacterium]NIT80386.1 molecular chaperone DnaK [Nitrospinaceae bacterium]NIU42729.1 molecular chaperone DnaK [Nitrospinaceae bacterium]